MDTHDPRGGSVRRGAVSCATALSNHRTNRFNKWNISTGGSSVLSSDPASASTRIYSEYAQLHIEPIDQKYSLTDPVFAMGSCFAREIETVLQSAGCNIVSMDRSLIDRPEFKDPEGRIKGGAARTGFFHRFTPTSMLQEFQWCLDEIPAWTGDSLVFPLKGSLIDVNYWNFKGIDCSREAIATRRGVMRQLVRSALSAKAIILTLGYIEAWYHRPSNLYTNYFTPKVVADKSDEFELHILDVGETIACLEEIHSLLTRKHVTGDFRIFVTVSPVPLGATFTDQDIVVANTNSKSVLRAAAGHFATAHENVIYFPSYEMVMNSSRDLAWRPDRIHVNNGMVQHITSAFTSAFFDLGEGGRPE
jgi:hypothetical protein